MQEQTIQILDEEQKAPLRRKRIFYSVLMYGASILAVLCLLGVLVSVMILNFSAHNASKELLLYSLAGAFVGGAALMALCTYLMSRLISAVSLKELDLRERLDDEESFFVGEGTLLTFGETGLTLHGEQEGTAQPAFIPYHDTRYISICTRRRAREKGSWCVAIEIPVHYITKNTDCSADEKVLVQADSKERLYRALEKHGLTLLGEERKENAENKKFTPVQKFTLPNRAKRKRALFFLLIGILLVGGCAPLGIYANPAIGALVGAVGLVICLRSTLSLIKAKAVFGVYQEGIFWRESNGVESLFLKWEDIEKVELGEQKGYPIVTFYCDYGKYAIPAVDGAFECINRLKEEKCVEKK